MKTNLFKYSFGTGFILVLAACSTKKDSLINRNFHAVNTEYNILYNGNIALEAGIKDLKNQYKDNFWEPLPIERMQITKEEMLPGQTKNANFERAETKAIKAIQKHSMNIQGEERNPQMDEAHLLLGKARYYDKRFIPALEAFNYVLYKYPKSDKIYEVKVWREKTNIRMENDALAVKNLKILLNDIKFKDQIIADANAILAQAFLNLEQQDSAVVALKKAVVYTRENEEKARYRFILGQLYDKKQEKDSAFLAYQAVIDMNRKSPRQYVIQAHAHQAAYFDFEHGDTLLFVKKYNKLLKDRENRPYLDVLNHQMGLFYEKAGDQKKAMAYYNKSLRTDSQDQYLAASNYRNMAEMYFHNAKYPTAGKYYDSTLIRLNNRTREYRNIKKKRENLVDVIKYEAIAQHNDSILKLVAMSDEDKASFFQDYIVKLKKEDALRKIQEEAAAASQNNSGNMGNTGTPMAGNTDSNDPNSTMASKRKAMEEMNSGIVPPPTDGPVPPVTGNTTSSTFPFYNPTTLAYGKNEFRKKWGKRTLKDNWRLSVIKSTIDLAPEEITDTDTAEGTKEKVENPAYNTDFYISQIPTDTKVIDSLGKERNFAYYQLGIIYKEKFKENQLAASKLEQLLENKPEERLVLPTLYNLYKIYEITDPAKAEAMKARIVRDYPETRYAQILENPTSAETIAGSPEEVYAKLFRVYEKEDYKAVLATSDALIDQYTGEDIVSKFELLKANTLGKLKGLGEYKTALNFVALNYPNSEEGKQAESLLHNTIPTLESAKFDAVESASWKIIFKVGENEKDKIKYLQDKLKKVVEDRKFERLTLSFDNYTMDNNFIVIHNLRSEAAARNLETILKEYKDYKITEPAIIISSENYKIVQFRKNIEEYLTLKK